MFDGREKTIESLHEPHPYSGGSVNENISTALPIPDFQFHDQIAAGDVREGRPFDIKINFLKHADFSEDKSIRTPFSYLFVTEIKSKVIQGNLTPDMLDGTLYSPKLGSPPQSVVKGAVSRECATCHSRNCGGHFGKITFPEPILNPYANLVNELIDILSCLCPECTTLLVPPEILREKGIESVPKALRIKKILEWSSGQSIICRSGTGKCKKKKYTKRPSFEEGVIMYEEGSSQRTYSADQINDLLHNLPEEVISLLGFDDKTEFDKYTLVGIPVPPIHVRLPTKTKNDTIPHPFTVALSEIVGLRNNWAASLQTNALKDELLEYGISTTQIPTTIELRNEIGKITGQIVERINELNQKEQDIQTKLPELKKEAAKLQKEIDSLSSADASKKTTLSRKLRDAQTKISRLQVTVEKANLQTLEDRLKTLQAQNDFLAKNQHRLAMTGSSRVFIAGGDARTNMKKLYQAVAAHFKAAGALFQSKRGLIRSSIAAKRSDFTARAVIVPNTYSRLDTLEVPERIAREAGITSVVTEKNIRRYTLMLKQGRITFIESRRSNGRIDRMAVTKIAISRNACRIRIGDTVTRWLMDGDVVIAGREPSLHPGNIMAFYARITPYNVIGVPFGIVTPWAGDFDGDEVHISIPQTEGAQEEAKTIMLSSRNVMGIRSGTPIIGVIYNALKNWHIATTSTELFSERLINDAIQDASTYTEDEDLTGNFISTMNSWKRRCELHRVSWRSGSGLFSWLLPVDLEFPPGASRGARSPNGVRIVDGILVEGVITEQEISANKSGTIIHYLKRHYYDYTRAALFIQKAFRLGDFIGRFFPLSMGPLDCSLAQCGIERSVFASRVEDARKEMAALGPEPTDSYEKIVYEQSLSNINQTLMEENRELYEKFSALNTISEEQRSQLRALRLRETKLTDQFSIAYKNSDEEEMERLQAELDEIDQQILQFPMSVQDIDHGIMNQFYLGISAGTKGSKSEFGEMVGVIGQLTMEEGRVDLDTSCKTRCLTSFRVGDTDPRARGFVSNNFNTGLRPDEKFISHKVQRVGATSTAVSTPESGAIQRELATSLGKYYTENSCLVSQTNYVLQYLVGEDGFSSTETFPLYGTSVPFDPMAVADMVNQELGWHFLEDGWYHEHVFEGEIYYVKYD